MRTDEDDRDMNFQKVSERESIKARRLLTKGKFRSQPVPTEEALEKLRAIREMVEEIGKKNDQA